MKQSFYILPVLLASSGWLVADEPAAKQSPWFVESAASRPIDDQHGFRILTWQLRHDARESIEAYEKLHLRGWHIDRGEGKQDHARWARKQNWPYYVDHAAGKGILHLTKQSGLDTVSQNGTPSPRPWSFFDPRTIEELTNRLNKNLPDVSDGPVLAIALDDEVSLGHFNSPLEVDFSEAAIDAFEKWKRRLHNDRSADAPSQPLTYADVRHQINQTPPSEWQLSGWMDFRNFMDQSQASLFAKLTRHSNELAPEVPTGIVGSQQPSVYGGFNYSLLRDAVQWMEAYDIGGTNEILRSFWADGPRRGRMQTYFVSGELIRDRWFLWYYLAHGCRGVIAWPETNGKLWFDQDKVNPSVLPLATTMQEVQADPLAILAHPMTEPVFSPIAILYSHPSVQVGWAIDAATHGKTWPRRSSSLDNQCLSSGKNRVAWTRLLEDLGHQARFIDESDLANGCMEKEGMEILILPQAFAMSQSTIQRIKDFAARGGSVIADYGTAITDDRGNGYSKRPLDSLFGLPAVQHTDINGDPGWFDGKQRWEINGELYRRPLVERCNSIQKIKQGSQLDWQPIPIERRLNQTWVTNQFGRGHSLFLNESPTAYFDAGLRHSTYGKTLRDRLRSYLDTRLSSAESVQLIDPNTNQHPPGIELLRYQTNETHASSKRTEIWAIVANPTRQATVDGPGSSLKLDRESRSLQIRGMSQQGQLSVSNLRTGKAVTNTNPIRFELPPGEAVILAVTEHPVE